MSKLNVEKVPSVEDRHLPIFDEFNEIADKIRVRAFNLFADRGFDVGNDVADWLQAEREICWPSAELVEDEDEYEVKVALAGFDRDDITVTATPREVIVKASHSDEQKKSGKEDGHKIHWSEFRSNDVYRRIPLPSDVDVSKIEAEFEHGMLEIEAPKARPGGTEGKSKKIKVKS